MRQFQLSPELVQYMPKGAFDSFDEKTEMAYADASGTQFHRAVEFAECSRQQAESEHPDIYVLSGEQIRSDKYLSKFLRKQRTDHFMVLRRHSNMLDKMIVTDCDESDPLCLHKDTREVTMADMTLLYKVSRFSEPLIVKTAYENRIPQEIAFAETLNLASDDRYCFVLFFDHPIAVGIQKPDPGAQRMHDALCVVLQSENGARVRNMFTFATGYSL